MAIEPTVNSYWRGDGDGTNLIFTFPFSKFEDDDVFVYTYNTGTGSWDPKTVTTDYTINGSTVTFVAGKAPAAPPSAGFGNVLILRKTDFQTNKAQFSAGSSIRAKDLEDNFLQSIFADQEFRDQKVDKISPEFWGDVDMNDRLIRNLQDPIADGDAINKKYFEDRRTNTLVQQNTPSSAQEALGLHWLVQKDAVNEQAHKIYNGSTWVTVASGRQYDPQPGTRTRYVDTKNGSDDALNTGQLRSSPLKTIKRAVDLVNADPAGDGSLIWVDAGIYQEVLPITIQKDNVSIVGTTQRSCFISPKLSAADEAGYDPTATATASETKVMFEVDSGTYLANFTFCGLKASGPRGGHPADSTSAVYGLPTEQGWAVAFRNGVSIKKSPYIQNCVSYTDSEVDNGTTVYDANGVITSGFDPDTMSGLGGDQTSAPCGGGVIVDGSKCVQTSPLRSMVVDAYTQINLNGPGVLATNNAYAQLVSFFGTFCHYHAKARNGSQLNLSNCTTDFGEYGLIAEGRSSTPIATASVVDAAAIGDVFFKCTIPAPAVGFHGSSVAPRRTHIIEVGGVEYPIKDYALINGGTEYKITVHNPNAADPSINDGLTTVLNPSDGVNIYLKSMITTGGHVFEYVGSGTDYSAHPDNGGEPNPAQQAIEIGSGQVWLSGMDEDGRFVVGSGNQTVFEVNQLTGSVTLPSGGTLGLNIVSDTTPQLGGDLDVNGKKITTAGDGHVIIDPAGTGEVQMNAKVVFDSTQPTASTTAPNIVQLSNDYQAGSSTVAATPSAVKSLMPAGSVIMFAGSTAPAGYLEMKGQSVPNGNGTIDGITTNFSALRSAIGSTIPDMRGRFARGWDHGRGLDSGRNIRSGQGDAFESHKHSVTSGGSHSHGMGSAGSHNHSMDSAGNHRHSYEKSRDGNNFGGDGQDVHQNHQSANTNYAGSHTHSINSAGSHSHSINSGGSHSHGMGNTGGSETRPTNIALMYCIKY